MFGHEDLHYVYLVFQQEIDQVFGIGLGEDAGLVTDYPYFFALKEG
jgi:hypothetical protein